MAPREKADTSDEIDELLKGSEPERVEAATTVIAPTLLVGLGGTGAEVLRRVKQRIRRLGIDDAFRFLVVDMDDRSQKAQKGLPGFSDEEFLFLDREDAGLVLERPEEHDALAKRLDLSDERVTALLGQLLEDQDPGAGQVRPIGMLGLHIGYEALERVLQRSSTSLLGQWAALRNRLAGIGGTSRDGGNTVDVVVVSSVCGGTGSSILVDVAVAIRRTLGNAIGRMSGYLTLADVHHEHTLGTIDQWDRLRANTYATLRELDYFQSGVAATHKFEIRRLNGAPLSAPKVLFKPLYLVERKDSRRRDLASSSAVFDSMALAIAADIATSIGGVTKSAAANDTVLKGLVNCPRTGRPRTYSTFRATGLRFPLGQAVRYCAYRQAFEFTSATVGGTSAAATSSVVQEADRWLAEARIEERKELHADMLLDRLEAAVRPDLLVKSLFLDPVAKTFHRDARFAELYRLSELDWEGKERGLGWIGAGANTSADKFAETAVEALGRKIAALAGERGLVFAHDVAHQIELSCRKTAEELRGEATDFAKQTPLMKQDEKGVYKRLSGWPLRETDVQTELIEKVQARRLREVGAAYRRAAAALHDTVADEAKALQGPLSRLKSVCEGLKSKLQDDMVANRSRPGAIVTDCAAEVDVSTPEILDRLYAKHAQPIEGLGARLLETLAAEEGRRGSTAAQLEASVRRTLTREAAAHFLSQFRGLNLAVFVDGVLTEGGDPATDLRARLEETLTACRPLWLASIGKAGAQFSDSVVVGWPEGASAATAAATQQAIDNASAALAADASSGAQPAVVTTADPHRIMAIRRVHGGLPFYLERWADYRTAYESWIKDGKNPIHVFSKKDVAQMPTLEPTDVAGGGGEKAFAVAIALGWIAVRGQVFYFNLEETPDGRSYLVPATSKWDGLVYDAEGNLRADLGCLAPALTGEQPAFRYVGKKSANSECKLAEKPGFETAVKAFVSSSSLVLAVERAYERLCDICPPREVAAALDRYADALDRRSDDSSLAKVYERHAGRLRGAAVSLRNR